MVLVKLQRVDTKKEPEGWTYLEVKGHNVKIDWNDWIVQRHYHWRLKKKGKALYPYRRFHKNGKTYRVMLHNSIMQPPPGFEVHHIHHDTLDVRRSELLNVPHEQHPR